MEHENVVVGFSELEGRKLFAKRDFRQGEEILKLGNRTQRIPDMYSIQISPKIHIDCRDQPVGATNHSCDPNAAISLRVTEVVRLVAWKCIKAGEEITIDYTRTEEKLAAPFNCFCGAKNCKGRIE